MFGYSFVLVIVYAIFFNENVATVKAACESPWIKHDSECYYAQTSNEIFPGHKWLDARLVCQKYGGDLIKVDTRSARNFLEEFFKNSSHKYNHYWIGLSNFKTKGEWEWVDGTKLDKNNANWRTSAGEPNYLKNENCVETMLDGKWNDNSCDRIFGFICQRSVDSDLPPVPTLPTYPLKKEPLTCETGWIPWGTSCYGFIAGIYKSWFDAKSDCERRFGNLLIINSAEEQAFVTNRIGNTDLEYWIGLSDHYADEHFFWVDKTPLNKSHANWAPNEPSNEFGNEDCVEIYGKWMPGKWNDDHCSALQNYICEKNGGIHNCPQGWVHFRNYCYQINGHPNQAATWEDARKNCLDFNKAWRDNINVAQADLVSISSDLEQEMLVKEFSQLNVDLQKFWIGLTKTNSSKFYWTDGSPLKYKAWKSTIGIEGSHFNCAIDTMRSGINSWEPADCKQKHLYVCKVGKGQDRCYSPLGLQSYRVPNSAMRASSSLSHETGAAAGRLYLKANAYNGGAWCAGKEKYSWLQIDFGSVKKLTYMSIQGKSDTDAMVTSYYLKYSLDGALWELYGDMPPARYIKFRASIAWRTNHEKVMNLPLPVALVTRYIRVYPLEYNIAKCMRVEFYGCEEEVKKNGQCGLYWLQDEKTKNCYKFSDQKTTWDSAENLCNIQGGSLASVETAKEFEYLKKKLKDHADDIEDYWIGLNDLEAEGYRKWSDEQPYVFRMWYSGNPKKSNVKNNCAAMRTKDGYWTDEDCLSFKHFICKIPYKDPNIRKPAFNNNWKSTTDYFWPLHELPINDKLDGTVTANAFGEFTRKKFQKAYENEKQRYELEFTGDNTYITVDNLDDCVTHPDSNSCPFGITVSFNFKYKHESTTKEKVIVDTFDKADNSVGFKIYIRFTKVYVFLRGREYHFEESVSFEQDQEHHFAFTWSNLKGLDLYLDGNLSVTQLHGSINNKILRHFGSKRLSIGKSFYSNEIHSKYLHISSLAFFERVLDPSEVNFIYVAEFGHCLPHQLSHGSYCYNLNLTKSSFDKGKKYCKHTGGDVISIHSAIEQAFVSNLVGKNGAAMDSMIGFHNEYKKEYAWTDRTKSSVSFWGKDQPGNYKYSRCASADKYDGFWKLSSCYYSTYSPILCKHKKAMLGKEDYVSKLGETYEVELNSYRKHQIGCPYGFRLQLISALYGNKAKNCFQEIKDLIKPFCNGSICKDFRIYKLKIKDPCADVQGYISKKTYMKYICTEKIPSSSSSDCNTDSITGYSTHKNSNVCYKLYTYPRTFTHASNQCNQDGGTLVVINSRDTDIYLTSLMDSMFIKRDVWIGMKYDPDAKSFMWVNGTHVEYTQWYNGKPQQKDKHYISASVQNGARSFLYWKQEYENNTLPFFCQRSRQLKKSSLSTTVPTTTKAPNISCPSEWILYKKNCYLFRNDSLSYVDAKMTCKSLHGNLASILSADENNKIYEHFVKKSFFFAWIGLSNEALISGFEWEDGSPLVYINWYFNRPYTGNKHFCTGMNSGSKWWDISCTTKFPFICKKSAIVDDAATEVTEIPPVTIPDKKDNKTICVSDEWIEYNNSCYYVSNSSYKVDYYTARSACSNMKSNVVSILSKQENQFVMALLKKKYIYSGVFIGLTDMTAEGSWQWEDKSPVRFLNFGEEEPDNFQGMEDCTTTKRNGEWRDVACNLKRRFICKQNNDSKTSHYIVTAPKITGFCADGWIRFRENCYLIVKEKKLQRPFQAAVDFCKDKGGKLATIHSSYENAFILSQLDETDPPAFIGMYDSSEGRDFTWMDQSPVQYTNWDKREPSYYPRSEFCVHMKTSYGGGGKWNNINCDFPHSFVCQKSHESGPVPTKSKPGKDNDDGYNCPKGFLKYRTSCFKRFLEGQSFVDALSKCREFDNGDLISVHNPFEQAFVFSNYIDTKSPESWIGLKVSGLSDGTKSYWSDNSTLYYENYYRGRYERPESQLQCGIMDTSLEVSGKWKFMNCNFKKPYICKVTQDFDDKETTFIGNCSDGWTKIFDKCYKIFSAYPYTGSWSSGRKTCKGFGGDLAEVSSSKIQLALQKLAKDVTRSLWIGLNDRQVEGVYEWSNGKTLLPNAYTNWYFNEPNDKISSENCVQFMKSGMWNDAKCHYSYGAICEHSLVCNNALGMEDGSIPNENIQVSSSYADFTKTFVRMSSNVSVWCTNVTTMEENLTVNLGEMMSITRIVTKGLWSKSAHKRSYVTSYLLEYSNDGKHWVQYVDQQNNAENTQTTLIKRESLSRSISGASVDVKASHLRLTPKSFTGDLICMSVEFYGCKAKCKRALGMEQRTIHDNQLQVSSEKLGSEKQFARPNNNNKYWCAHKLTMNEYFEVNFERMVNITRVIVTSKHPIKYQLQLSDDGKSYRTHVTYNGHERIFDSKHTTYDLTVIETTKYIRIVPKEWSKSICLQVEFYGCLYECDSPLGMETGEIPTDVITSSTYKVNFTPNMARILESSKDQAWCAEKNNPYQYIEIDFKQKAHINRIAVQGIKVSDTEKYVKVYRLQWSNDNDFWHQYEGKVVGNINGHAIVTRKLRHPIYARYIRINPIEWHGDICMRLEFYGCPLNNITSIINKKKKKRSGKLRITSLKYKKGYADRNNDAFKYLAEQVEEKITDLYIGVGTFKDGFDSVYVEKIIPGSVIVFFTIYTVDIDNDVDVTKLLKNALNSGMLGQFTVDQSYTEFDIHTDSDDQKSRVSQENGGMSTGVKIFLILFFILLVAIVLVVGTLYYKRAQHRLNLRLPKKAFSRTSRKERDEMEVEFINEEET